MPSNVEDHPYREFEHAGWERAAPSYAGSFEAITTLFAKRLLDAIGGGLGIKLLDVACGSGCLAAMAAESGAQVEAVDFSPNMVNAATTRYPALSFRVADAEALPFADNTFDAVVIGFGVHHFPFPLRALVESRRVLRTGGRLGFTVWAPMDEHLIQKVVVDAVREPATRWRPCRRRPQATSAKSKRACVCCASLDSSCPRLAPRGSRPPHRSNQRAS